MSIKLSKEKEAKILKEVKDRLAKAIDFDKENRRKALDDLEFIAVEESQWPAHIRAERIANQQPCLTINKMPVFIDQVVGDQRQNRPSIKVIPVDSGDDKETARILGGWIRHVQSISKSDITVDHAFEHAVACGYGAMRVVTKCVSDNSFDQEAYIEKIDNALAVYWGFHTNYDCSDAQYCFVVSDMDRDEYESKFERKAVSFREDDSSYSEGWSTKDKVRVAEYFVKEPIKRTIYLLNSGSVVDVLPEGEVPKNKRVVDTYKIMWYLVSGDAVLEAKEWPGKKYIPIIPVWGKEFNVGGKRYLRGLIRNAKDAQRMYNYWQSIDTEVVALQPRNPYLVTPEMIADHQPMWDEAGKKNRFYLLYNPDRNAPSGKPSREAPPQASSAMVQKIAMADQEMRDTVGLQKASLGMASNERSGTAIRERKQEGDTATYAFIDNLSRSIEHMGRVLVDVAPVILDTERIIRLGLDNGEFGFDAINVESNGKVLHDLSVGTYDVVVTVGPSFSTQRTEARQSMQEFIQYYPAAAPLVGDLYAKAMDWVGAEEFAERLAEILPPEIKKKSELKKAKQAGASEEELMQLMQPQPPPPNPLEEAKIQQAQMDLKISELKMQQEMEGLKYLQLKNQFDFAKSKDEIGKLVDEIANEKLQGIGGMGNEQEEAIG